MVQTNYSVHFCYNKALIKCSSSGCHECRSWNGEIHKIGIFGMEPSATGHKKSFDRWPGSRSNGVPWWCYSSNPAIVEAERWTSQIAERKPKKEHKATWTYKKGFYLSDNDFNPSWDDLAQELRDSLHFCRTIFGLFTFSTCATLLAKCRRLLSWKRCVTVLCSTQTTWRSSWM